MSERPLRQQIKFAMNECYQTFGQSGQLRARAISDPCISAMTDAALSTLSSAPITDAEVEAAAQAVMPLVAKWAEPIGPTAAKDIARAALTASRKWMAATSKPEGE